ncbi:MAG: chlorophyllide a reductase iron protein subunit X [Chloroflexaceae bacterium]|nr:chlorophyllide a reductase iron protein subunit X [Chloroflexaceae bacterium]
MLAVYGKGGSGKSFFTTNLVGKFALLGQRVLQLGCDPKHDSCNALFGGASLVTLGDTWRDFREQGREDELAIEHVIFKTEITNNDRQATVFGCEIGGPEVGRGCGGRGITLGFDVLDRLGMRQWLLDFVVMDFLGDVVCGGFATPLARSLAEEVIILCGNDRQSLFAANNIVRAAHYFTSLGGSTRLLGLVINRDDGSGIAEAFAERTGLPVLLKIPVSHKVRELADSCKLALIDPAFDSLFDQLAQAIIHSATPQISKVQPLDYKAFLQLFGAEEPDITPTGASASDLLGVEAVKPVLPIALDPAVPAELAVGAAETPTTRVIQRLLHDLGLYVTETSHDVRKGLTLTIDGNLTICFGNDQDLESKIAILAALRRSGEHYHYVDLRCPASPIYR